MWQALATVARNCTIARMEYDEDKVDEMALALLFLTLRDGYRAWKAHDWSAVDRLHKKGRIANSWKKPSLLRSPRRDATFARIVHEAFRQIRLTATSSDET